MPELQNIYQYEPGSGDTVSPKSGMVKPEIIRSLDIPFASRTSPGTDKTQRGMMTRCTEHGAILAKRREVLTLVATDDFTLHIGSPFQGFTQSPQIDAFSFRFLLDTLVNKVEWKFVLDPGVLKLMVSDIDYFFPVRAKNLLFAMQVVNTYSLICQLKTYRYE